MKYVLKCTDDGCYVNITFFPMIAKKVNSIKDATKWDDIENAELIATELVDVKVVEVK